MTQEQSTFLSKVKKNIWIYYFLWLPFGFLGAHRLYLGKITSACLMTASFGVTYYVFNSSGSYLYIKPVLVIFFLGWWLMDGLAAKTIIGNASASSSHSSEINSLKSEKSPSSLQSDKQPDHFRQEFNQVRYFGLIYITEKFAKSDIGYVTDDAYVAKQPIYVLSNTDLDYHLGVWGDRVFFINSGADLSHVFENYISDHLENEIKLVSGSKLSLDLTKRLFECANDNDSEEWIEFEDDYSLYLADYFDSNHPFSDLIGAIGLHFSSLSQQNFALEYAREGNEIRTVFEQCKIDPDKFVFADLSAQLHLCSLTYQDEEGDFRDNQMLWNNLIESEDNRICLCLKR